MVTSTPQRLHQPGGQIKVACPNCGAIARLTYRTLKRSGGYPICPDGGTFGPVPSRAYTPRRTSETVA